MRKIYGKHGLSSPSWMVKKIGNKAYIESFERLAKEHAPGKLLDIGCGAGEKKSVIPLNADYFGVDTIGCPHGNSAIDTFCLADSLSFLDATFDTVFCSGVLEQLETPQKAIEESYRVLNPGGYAIYSIPLFWHIHEEPRDFYRYTKYGIRYLFEKAGYEIIELKPLSGFWVTFGSELNYYLQPLGKGIMRYAIKALTAFFNAIFLFLDIADRRINPRFDKWTWMYLIIARK